MIGSINMEKFERGIYYKVFRNKELQWLSSIQLPCGAIPLNNVKGPEGYVINPYFSTIACEAFLTNPIFFSNAKKYIEWHLNHINQTADEQGVIGSIYDYFIDDDELHTIRKTNGQPYDSIDSYASMFLYLIDEYVKKTLDYDLLRTYKNNLIKIAQALNSCWDNTYNLTKATIQTPIFYLMDNCETVVGYTALEHLNLYGDINNALPNINIKNLIDIESFWDAPLITYAYAIDNIGNKHMPNFVGDYYPNIVAQIFPILYKDYILPMISTERVGYIIDKYVYYDGLFPFAQHIQTLFPHCESLFYSLIMKEEYNDSRLDYKEFLKSIDYRINTGRSYYYCHDVGRVVLSLDKIIKNLDVLG